MTAEAARVATPVATRGLRHADGAWGDQADDPWVKVQLSSDQLQVVGSINVDRRDFNVSPPDISFTKAEPGVVTEYSLLLVRTEARNPLWETRGVGRLLTPEDMGREIGDRALARRVDSLNGPSDLVLGDTRHQFRQEYLRLESREGRAQAMMNALPKRNVALWITFQVQFVGEIPASLVSIG